MLARLAAHLHGGLGEADHARGADRVRRQHAARHVDRQVAVERGRALVGQLPALALGAKPRFSSHIGSNQRERHVDLGAVDLLAGIGDAGLLVELGRAVAAGLRVHLVAPGEHGRLGAHRRARASRPAGFGAAARRRSFAITIAQAPSEDGQVSR